MIKTLLRFAAAACVTIAFTGSALAQRVVIGHFGDPFPDQAAAAHGKFAKTTGWKIDWRKFNSGADVIAAMTSGDIKISELGSVPFAIAVSQGVPIEAILISSVIGSSESLIVRNGAGISKPADLKGKRIAVPIASTSHLSLIGALKHWHINQDDVHIIGMNPAQINAAWAQDYVDAAFVWYPVQGELLKNGTRMVSATEVAGWGYPTFNVWAVNKEFAAGHRELLVAFVKAMNEANEAYLNNKAGWTATSEPVMTIAKRTGAIADQIPAVLAGNQFLTPNEQISAAWLNGGATKALKATAAFLKSVGQIGSVAADYGRFVDASFAKEAAR